VKYADTSVVVYIYSARLNIKSFKNKTRNKVQKCQQWNASDGV